MTTLPGPLRESIDLRHLRGGKFILHYRHAARANQENRRHKQRESSQTQVGFPFPMEQEHKSPRHHGASRSETKERNDLRPNRCRQNLENIQDRVSNDQPGV